MQNCTHSLLGCAITLVNWCHMTAVETAEEINGGAIRRKKNRRRKVKYILSKLRALGSFLVIVSTFAIINAVSLGVIYVFEEANADAITRPVMGREVASFGSPESLINLLPYTERDEAHRLLEAAEDGISAHREEQRVLLAKILVEKDVDADLLAGWIRDEIDARERREREIGDLWASYVSKLDWSARLSYLHRLEAAAKSAEPPTLR